MIVICMMIIRELTNAAGHNDVAVLQKSLEGTQLDITVKSRELELKQISSSDKVRLLYLVQPNRVSVQFSCFRRWSWGAFDGS